MLKLHYELMVSTLRYNNLFLLIQKTFIARLHVGAEVGNRNPPLGNSQNGPGAKQNLNCDINSTLDQVKEVRKAFLRECPLHQVSKCSPGKGTPRGNMLPYRETCTCHTGHQEAWLWRGHRCEEEWGGDDSSWQVREGSGTGDGNTHRRLYSDTRAAWVSGGVHGSGSKRILRRWRTHDICSGWFFLLETFHLRREWSGFRARSSLQRSGIVNLNCGKWMHLKSITFKWCFLSNWR